MYHIILTGAFCKYKRSQIIIFIFILSLIWLPSKFFPYFLQYLANKQYVNLKFLWVLLLWTDKPTSIRKKNKKTKTLLYINSDVKITCPFFLKKKKKSPSNFRGPPRQLSKSLKEPVLFSFLLNERTGRWWGPDSFSAFMVFSLIISQKIIIINPVSMVERGNNWLLLGLQSPNYRIRNIR